MVRQRYINGFAYSYGATAYKNGIQCDPAKDEKFASIALKGGGDEKIRDRYIKDWIEGWEMQRDNE